MSYEFSGKLIEKFETQQITERFKKREFVLEHIDEVNGREFINHIKFQLTQDNCDLLDIFNLNDEVKVHFNLRGRRWEKDGNVSYFTNLEAWRLESLSVQPDTMPPPEEDDLPPEEDDDVPF